MTDELKNTNIKLNPDGTVSPIDPTKPSRYSTLPNTENTDELDQIFNQFLKESIRYGGIETYSLTIPRAKRQIQELIAKECTKAKLNIAKLAAQMAHDDPEYTLQAFAEDLEFNTLRQDKEMK